jgi:membrane protease subunit (stomatin/prohibitin family)
MTRVTRQKKAQEKAQEVCPQTHLVCPRCAGSKRVLDFRSGDRITGEPAGWKATLCPGCGGTGSVDEPAAAAILETLAKMKQDSSD